MDIGLQYSNDLEDLSFDISLVNNDLAHDAGLQTAVVISLYTDARASVDEIPDGQEDPRGWWGDGVSNPQQRNIGSKLWFLDRSKITDEVVEQSRAYTLDALQWMLDDGIAENITVEAERFDLQTIRISIDILRPQTETVNFKFDLLWEGQLSAIQ